MISLESLLLVLKSLETWILITAAAVITKSLVLIVLSVCSPIVIPSSLKYNYDIIGEFEMISSLFKD